jgi:hypothetical protein
MTPRHKTLRRNVTVRNFTSPNNATGRNGIKRYLTLRLDMTSSSARDNATGHDGTLSHRTSPDNATRHDGAAPYETRQCDKTRLNYTGQCDQTIRYLTCHCDETKHNPTRPYKTMRLDKNRRDVTMRLLVTYPNETVPCDTTKQGETMRQDLAPQDATLHCDDTGRTSTRHCDGTTRYAARPDATIPCDLTQCDCAILHSATKPHESESERYNATEQDTTALHPTMRPNGMQRNGTRHCD